MASSNVSISMMLTASSDTLRIVQRALHKYAEMVIDENMSVIHIIGSLHWKRTQVESHIMDTIKDTVSYTHLDVYKRQVKDEYKRAHVLPLGHQIFHIFNSCPFEKVKVVILGQDQMCIRDRL